MKKTKMIILEQFTFWMANSILPEKETGHPIWTAGHRARRKAAYKVLHGVGAQAPARLSPFSAGGFVPSA